MDNLRNFLLTRRQKLGRITLGLADVRLFDGPPRIPLSHWCPAGEWPCHTQLVGGALVAIPVASADPINTVWFIAAIAVGILPQRVCGPYLGGYTNGKMLIPGIP